MNKIYIDNGSYNFLYQIPQIIYSSLVSTVISLILKKLSLSERDILLIKKEKNVKLLQKKGLEIKKCLKIQFIIFYIISFLLIFFFWYFISCFCAVYKNTQIHLIKDTLISFGTSMISPLFLSLVPGCFRIPAIKKNKSLMYKFSKGLQFLM